MTQTQIFLYPGVSSFPDPGNWTAVNKVECVGNGGSGGAGDPNMESMGGGGGGGGGYAWDVNLTPTFPVLVFPIAANQIGLQQNPACSFGPMQSQGSWYSTDQQPGTVFAAGGVFGATTAGTGNGQAGATTWPNGNPGGAGAARSSSFGTGGGGAGGPQHAGTAGFASGMGGAANNTVAGGNPGGPGNSGNQWDAIHGVGSGGGGGYSSNVGGAGGWRGGGGGGGSVVAAGQAQGQGSPGLIVITYTPARTTTEIFLHNGVTSFPNPGNWNPTSNKVECVGMGGVGAPGLVGSFSASGPGGGGGGYGWAVNLGPTFPVTVNVPAYEPQPGFPAGTCFWNGTASSPGNVSAAFGFAGSNAISGGSSLGGGGGSAYPNPSVGGTGGNGVTQDQGQGAGGGGGGAGPHGNGLVGVAGSGNTSGAGGAGDAGNTPAPTSAGQMVTGTQWDNIYGVGSGGYAASGVVGNAGNFGGGGAGGYGYNEASSPSGAGGSPLMVITYTPLIPPAPQGQVQIMA